MKCIIMIQFLFFFFFFFCLLGSSNIFCIFHARLRYASPEEWNYRPGQRTDRLHYESVSAVAASQERSEARSSELTLFRKQTTLQRWTLLLCGFWSLESSWQCDIKAVSRLLLAANYIKQPRRFGFQNQNPLLPFFFFFFSIFSNFFEMRFFFFLICDETLDGDAVDRRQSRKKKKTSRTRLTAKQHVRGRRLTRADVSIRTGDDSDRLVLRYRAAAVPRLSWADRFMSLLMSVIGLFLKADLPLPDYFYCHPAVLILLLQYLYFKT